MVEAEATGAGRHYTFGVLGPLQVTRDGVLLALGGRQQRAVLARLLLADGTGVSVEQLADALWGEQVPVAAANTVQTYVFHLRQALEPDRDRGAPGQVVITDRGRYRLAIAPDALDSVAFERGVDSGEQLLADGVAAEALSELERALALWRGDVLADLADYEFVTPMATRLADRRKAAIEAKIDAELALGRHASVLGQLNELVARNPLNEGLHRQRIVALYRCGRPSDALAAYDQLRHHLADELGVDPSPPLQQLHQQVLTHEPALAWNPPPTRPTEAATPEPQPRPTTEPPPRRPFVGRKQELADLEAAVEDAVSTRGSLILLTGEPGIGKTRLISELGQRAASRGLRVVTGRCWEEGGAPPYWPWMQVVRSLGGDLERLTASAADPAGSGRGTARGVPEGQRIRQFDAVGRFLDAASSERPLLVMLDDVHAADEPSLLLLRFLGDTLAEASVMLLASYREREPRVRELGEAFAELTRVGRRVALRGLTPADVEAYVTNVTGSVPTRQFVARLHEITAGNPFFVGEIVRMLAAEDRPKRLDEAIQDPFQHIPEEVRTLIRRRVASLEREVVDVLRVAAVIGREFDLHLLQRTSRLTPARLLEVLREADTGGVITALPPAGHRYSFTHELVRETLYDDLPPARRMELHHEVARLVEAAYGDDLDPHLSEIARHLSLAAPLGDASLALEYLRRAGDRASALLAYEEAAIHYQRAVELDTVVGERSGKSRTELLLRLADARRRSGDSAEARTTFQAAIASGRRLGNGELLAQAALGYVSALGGFLKYAGFEVGGRGVGLLEEALAALPPEDSSLRAHLLAYLALEMWSGTEPIERRDAVSQQAIDMARRVGDSEALVTALHSRHWALATPGMARERLAHTEEMLRIARETVNPGIEFLAHNARFHCFLELCDRRGMDAESQAMSALAERLRQPFYQWHAVCLRTLHAMLDGRFEEAERLAVQARELGRLRESEFTTYVFRYAQMFAIRWAQGRLPELWSDIEDHGQQFPWVPRWRDALAAGELGDEQMARRELEREGTRGFADLPRDGLWLLHLCSLAEASVFIRDEMHAAQLFELLLPHADENAVSYSQQPFGPVALRLGLLAAALGHWKEADRHFANALARCELLGAPPIRVRVLLEHARALAARGEPADRGRCEAILDEAAQLCDELGMGALGRQVSVLRQPAKVEEPGADVVFRRDGDFWTIRYAGQTSRLRHLRGLQYLAFLLAAPHREIHVLELVQAAEGCQAGPANRDVLDPGSTPAVGSDAGPVLDDAAKQAYRRRLRELGEDLQEARSWNDLGRAAQLEQEIDALTAELARAVGFGGRDRLLPSPGERARVSVTKSVRSAIKAVGEHCLALGEHLVASIKTGRLCCYAPPADAPPRWTV